MKGLQSQLISLESRGLGLPISPPLIHGITSTLARVNIFVLSTRQTVYSLRAERSLTFLLPLCPCSYRSTAPVV